MGQKLGWRELLASRFALFFPNLSSIGPHGTFARLFIANPQDFDQQFLHVRLTVDRRSIPIDAAPERVYCGWSIIFGFTAPVRFWGFDRRRVWIKHVKAGAMKMNA